MQTSYFAKACRIPNLQLVSIARQTPPNFFGDYCPELAPPANLLYAYKDQKVSEQEFACYYYKVVLSRLDPKELYERYKDAVLCCWESPDKFCHRQIVSEWLCSSLGIEVPEL